MANKKVNEDVYPVASLVITKEKFTELLPAQIEKGNDLLAINVPIATYNDPYMGYARRPVDNMEYDEAAKNDFFAKFNRWHDRNKEIYRSSFAVANNVYFHEYETQIWNHFFTDDIIKSYKEDIGRLINQMQTDIERIDLIKCDVQEETAIMAEPKKLSQEIFIVHGHNEEMKQAVARVVSKLGLTPIILHEQANGGKTISNTVPSVALRFSISNVGGRYFVVCLQKTNLSFYNYLIIDTTTGKIFAEPAD